MPSLSYAWAWIRARLFLALVTPVFFGLAWTVVAEGVRALFPIAAKKLSKTGIPGFNALANYDLTYRIDCGHVVAVGFMLMVFYLWAVNLKLYLRPGYSRPSAEGIDPGRDFLVVRALGIVLLVADLLLFLLGMLQVNDRGWNAEAIPVFGAVIATAAYGGFTLFVAYFATKLEGALK